MNLKKRILSRLSEAIDVPIAETLAAGAARLEAAGLVADKPAFESAAVRLVEAVADMLAAIRGGLPAAAAAVVGAEAGQLAGLLKADDV